MDSFTRNVSGLTEPVTFAARKYLEALASLAPGHARFVQEFVVERNATIAARRAGYSRTRAHATGCEMKKDPAVNAAIEAGIALQRARLDELREILSAREKARRQGIGGRMNPILRRIQANLAADDARAAARKAKSTHNPNHPTT